VKSRPIESVRLSGPSTTKVLSQIFTWYIKGCGYAPSPIMVFNPVDASFEGGAFCSIHLLPF
jgi:hypothetical protein